MDPYSDDVDDFVSGAGSDDDSQTSTSTGTNTPALSASEHGTACVSSPRATGVKNEQHGVSEALMRFTGFLQFLLLVFALFVFFQPQKVCKLPVRSGTRGRPAICLA